MALLCGSLTIVLIVLLVTQIATSNWKVSGQELTLSRQKRLDDFDETSHGRERRADNMDENSALFRQKRLDDLESRISKKEAELSRFKRGDFARLTGVEDEIGSDDAQDGGKVLSRQKRTEDQNGLLDVTSDGDKDETVLSRVKRVDGLLTEEKDLTGEDSKDRSLLEERILSREKRSNANFMQLLRMKRSSIDRAQQNDVIGEEDDDSVAEIKPLSRQKRIDSFKVPEENRDDEEEEYFGDNKVENQARKNGFSLTAQNGKQSDETQRDEQTINHNKMLVVGNDLEGSSSSVWDTGTLQNSQTAVEIHRQKRDLRDDDQTARHPEGIDVILRKKLATTPQNSAATKDSTSANISAQQAASANREDKMQDNRQMFVRSKKRLQEDANLRWRLLRKWLDRHEEEAAVVRASADDEKVDDWLEELVMREQMALMNTEYGTRVRRERLMNATLTGDLSTLSKIQRDAEEILRRRALEGIKDPQVLKVPLKEKPPEMNTADLVAEMEKERDLDTEDEPFHTRTVWLEWPPIVTTTNNVDVLKEEVIQPNLKIQREKKKKKRNQKKNKRKAVR